MFVGGYVGQRIPDWGAVGTIIIVDSASGGFNESVFAFTLESDSGTGSVARAVPILTLTDSSLGDIDETHVWEEIFNYSGDLAVGDIFEVDGDKYLVTKNGNNVRPDYTGDYPILERGDGVIKYEDSESSRTIALEIIKEDRHI